MWNKEQGKLKTNVKQKLVWKILCHDGGHKQRLYILEPPSLYWVNLGSDFSCLKIEYFGFLNCNYKGCFLFYFLFSPPISRGHRNGVLKHSLQYRMQTPVESWNFLSPKSSVEFVLFLAGSISQSTLQLLANISKVILRLPLRCLTQETFKRHTAALRQVETQGTNSRKLLILHEHGSEVGVLTW